MRRQAIRRGRGIAVADALLILHLSAGIELAGRADETTELAGRCSKCVAKQRERRRGADGCSGRHRGAT